MAETDSERTGKFAAVLAAAEARVCIGGMQSKDVGERVADGQSAHLGRCTARGIKGGHQRAHACAGDAVDGNLMLLQPLQNTDVRQAQRAASLECNADGSAAHRLDGGQGGVGWGRGNICGFLRRSSGENQSCGKQSCGRFPTHGYAPR